MFATSFHRPARAAALLAVGAGLTLASLACQNQEPPTPTQSTSATTSEPTVTAAEASPTSRNQGTARVASPQAAASPSPIAEVYWPQQLEIPAIDLKAPVVQIGLEEDGAMEAPNGPDIVGWYTWSVAPGVDGNALMTAHVDWLDRESGQAQEAVFWDLKDVEEGDEIIVHAEEGKTFTYEVTDSVLVAFDDPEGVEYMEPTDEAQLTLITCEGDFDENTRNYDMRRIVIAQEKA